MSKINYVAKEVEYSQIVKFLDDFGFERVDDAESETTVEPDTIYGEEVLLKDLVTTYKKQNISIDISRVIHIERNGSESLIMLYGNIKDSEEEIAEIFDLDDFFSYFRNDIRETKILKILK